MMRVCEVEHRASVRIAGEAREHRVLGYLGLFGGA
jgi:hypothetical protein